MITNISSFQKVIRQGLTLAIEGNIITFGVTPDKPDMATALAYLNDGSYLWNNGLFMMRASVWLSAIGKFRPGILSACQTAWANKTVDGDFLRINKTAFEQCPSDLIDYTVMEKIACQTTHRHSIPLLISEHGTHCGKCCPKMN